MRTVLFTFAMSILATTAVARDSELIVYLQQVRVYESYNPVTGKGYTEACIASLDEKDLLGRSAGRVKSLGRYKTQEEMVALMEQAGFWQAPSPAGAIMKPWILDGPCP
jgi:hypothetical protein